jgi:two-component sensor histidine kinase
MATPLGLIANEFVIDELKHAFPSRRPGTVTITLRDEGGNIVMQVADDGAGCAGKLPSSGVGTTLVSALVRQLGETLSFEVEKGCFARLVVPKIIPLEMSTLGTPLPPDFVYSTLRRSPG